MPALAYRVPLNFKWRIEAIAPTRTDCGKSFHWVDPHRVASDGTPGGARAFHVTWESSEPHGDVEDVSDRWADVEVHVVVTYPGEWELMTVNAVSLQDRHSLLKALRTSDSYTGYSTAHNDDDIGLEDRQFVGDELSQESEHTWRYRQTWRCTIKESE